MITHILFGVVGFLAGAGAGVYYCTWKALKDASASPPAEPPPQ